MQPYQRAGEAMQKKSDQAASYLKKAGKIGLETAASIAGSPIIARALPFLAEGVTAETAIKGLTALSPKFGKFIDKSLKSGMPFNEIKSFMANKFAEAEETTPKSLFQKLIADVDPNNLDESMQKKLQFLAPVADQLEKKGKDEKDPAVKKLKAKINKILKGKTGLLDQEQDRFQQEYGDSLGQDPMQQQPDMGQPMQEQMPDQMGGQQPQQGGQGQEALMAILQKIQATRGLGG